MVESILKCVLKRRPRHKQKGLLRYISCALFFCARALDRSSSQCCTSEELVNPVTWLCAHSCTRGGMCVFRQVMNPCWSVRSRIQTSAPQCLLPGQVLLLSSVSTFHSKLQLSEHEHHFEYPSNVNRRGSSLQIWFKWSSPRTQTSSSLLHRNLGNYSPKVGVASQDVFIPVIHGF